MNKYNELQKYIAGDFSKEKIWDNIRRKELQEIRKYQEKNKKEILLQPEVFLTVLKKYIDKKITMNQLGKWGELIFWRTKTEKYTKNNPDDSAFCETKSSDWPDLLIELLIDNDTTRELIMRLECIGDKIDGTFSYAEAIKFYKVLEKTTKELLMKYLEELSKQFLIKKIHGNEYANIVEGIIRENLSIIPKMEEFADFLAQYHDPPDIPELYGNEDLKKRIVKIFPKLKLK